MIGFAEVRIGGKRITANAFAGKPPTPKTRDTQVYNHSKGLIGVYVRNTSTNRITRAKKDSHGCEAAGVRIYEQKPFT